MRMHNPAHPGRILAYYIGEYSVTEVAKRIGVTRPALSRVLHGKAGVSADMALRLSEAFGTEPDLWLRLQMQRDLWEASRKKRPRVKPFPSSVAA
jgi:addiction module HigA family antidote